MEIDHVTTYFNQLKIKFAMNEKSHKQHVEDSSSSQVRRSFITMKTLRLVSSLEHVLDGLQ